MLVVGDLPPPPDDPPRREIEEACPPPDLDLLPVRQPPAILEPAVLQDDGDVLQLPVEIRGGSEAEAEAHQLRGAGIEVERAHHERQGERSGPDLHLPHRDVPAAGGDGERVAEGVLVGAWARAGERVDGVSHLVALADPDHVAEVVGDDPEMVAMVLDVGGEERAVPPAEHHLLAAIGCLPIHFDVELVGLHQAGRLGQSLADLRQEEDEPMGPGSIAPKRRIGLDGGALSHRSPDQGERIRRVPPLRRQRRRDGQT